VWHALLGRDARRLAVDIDLQRDIPTIDRFRIAARISQNRELTRYVAAAWFVERLRINGKYFWDLGYLGCLFQN
jgi:hypothetical protein